MESEGLVFSLKNNLVDAGIRIGQLESDGRECRCENLVLEERLVRKDLELERKNEEFISLRYNIDALESELYEML